jgi:hypothetical protein
VARKPNYQFERSQRDRIKAEKVAQKAAAKRALTQPEGAAADDDGDAAPPAKSED